MKYPFDSNAKVELLEHTLSVFGSGRGTVDALLCPIVDKVLAAFGQVVAGAKGLIGKSGKGEKVKR